MSAPKPGECDHCWQPSVVTFRVGCQHEHLGTASVCEGHAPMYRRGHMYCVPCMNNYPMFRSVGEAIQYPGHSCVLLAVAV